MNVWEKLAAMKPGETVHLTKAQADELLYWQLPTGWEVRNLRIQQYYDIESIDYDIESMIYTVKRNGPTPSA